MAEEELQTVVLRDDFYRDSFGKVVLVIFGIVVAIICLIALSVYLYLSKPPPVTFHVDGDWRVQAPVPLDQPYFQNFQKPDLLQWVADSVPQAFHFDFNHYNDQLKVASQYFTAEGWKIFLNQLNIYANYNNVQSGKLFVRASPSGAPSLVNEGLLGGRYAWLVVIPITISYSGYKPPGQKDLQLQVTVVRVSTLNNLTGVGIDNVVVVNGSGS
jgi:intracellular multiplication protein IcmL